MLYIDVDEQGHRLKAQSPVTNSPRASATMSQTSSRPSRFWPYRNTLPESDTDIADVYGRYKKSWTWFNFADCRRPVSDKNELTL